MKRSNIILLLTVAFAAIYFIYPPAFGFISVDQQGNPTDLMSKFWFNSLPSKIKLDLEQSVNHIKIIGNEGATVSLEINQGTSHLLNSDDLQNFDYKRNKDTLEIRLNKGDTYLYLEQPIAVESISCTNQVNLQLIPIQSQDSIQQLAINLENDCQLEMGAYTKKYKNGSVSGSSGPVKIKNLKLDLSNQSKAYLSGLQTDKCTVNLTDAYLNCEQSRYIDSLKIHLNGKSTVKNTYSAKPYRRTEVIENPNKSNIGHLIVSGDMSYFNKEFITSKTQITIQ